METRTLRQQRHRRRTADREAATQIPGDGGGSLAEVEAIAGVGSWQYDVATGTYAWSPGMFHLLGLAPAAGVPALDAVCRRYHPEDTALVEGAVARALSAGEPFALDARLLLDEGAVRWVHLRGRAARGAPGGPVVKLVCTVQDITERKEAEVEREATLRALEASQQQMRHALEQVNCLLWRAEVHEGPPPHSGDSPPSRLDIDLFWDLHVINETDVASWLPLARSPGESLTNAWLNSRDQEDQVAAELVAREALRGGLPRYSQTFRHHMADGTVHWMLEDVRVEPLPSPGTTRTGRRLHAWQLTGVVTEITERKREEIAREAVLEELESSRVRLRQVMEHANCLLWRAYIREYRRTPDWQVPPFDAERNTSLHFDMQIMNEAEVHWWLPLERREGEPFAVSWYLARHPGDSAEGDRRLHTALHGGLGRYTQTFRTSVEGGALRWLQEDVRIEVLPPIPEVSTGDVTSEATDGAGELMRRWQLTGVVTDVTERKQVEERLEALASELRRSNNHLQEFAYIASHDLKEPLRKIRTFADMLCRQASARLEEDDRDCLDRMVSAAERMARLIDGLLQYSRVSRRPTTSVPVPLEEVMAGVISDLEVRIAEAGARIDVGPLPTIPGDALELRQLFQNLIANSLKFYRSGVPPVVTVRAEQRSPDAVTLVFSDNGIGFAPEHAERIFSLFERLEARNRFEGSGIGLTICRKIAERHGGAITAIGVEGAGASFEVWLPLEAPAEPH